MPRDRDKLSATGRGGVTPPEWDQAMDLVSTGAVRYFLEDLLAYLDVGLPVSPLANDWMREQADRAAQLAERGIEEIARTATALERAEQAAQEHHLQRSRCMSDDLQLTRRGLFHFITTFIATATFAARRPLLTRPRENAIEAEIIEDEPPPPRLGRSKLTKLEVFLKSRGIKPAHLARESGYSRQHLLRIRMGPMEPTRRCMVEVAAACARLSRERVTVSDLFDLLPVLRLLPSPRSVRALTDGGAR